MRVALSQIKVETNQYQKNLAKIIEYIGLASQGKADLVVFPECSDHGWLTALNPDEAHDKFEYTVAEISALAKKYEIYICIGLTDGCTGRLYNTAVLISPEGELLFRHNKINLLDFERKVYSPGNKVSVLARPIENTSILICADNFPDSLYLGRSVGLMGAKLLLSPSSWAIEPGLTEDPDESMWITSYTKLAKEYGITTIAVDNVGIMENEPWNGFPCIGNSVVVGHDGKIIYRCSFGEKAEEIAFVDLANL